MDKKMKKRMLRRRRPRLGGPQRRPTTRRAPSGGHRRAAPGKMSKHQQQQKLKRGGARQRQDEIRRLDLVLTTKNRKTVENRMAKGNKDNGGTLQWEAAATLAAEHPDWSAQDAVVHSSSGGDGDSSNGRIGKIAQERRQRRAAHSETTATQLGPAEGCSRYSCGRNCSSSGAPVLPTTVTQVHRHTTRQRAALAEEGASSQFASVATTLKKRNAPIRPLEGRASPYHPLLAAHKTCTTTFITIDAKRRCRPNNKGTTNNLLPNKAAIEEQLANTIHYQPRLQKQSNQTEIHQPKEGNAPSANGIGFGGDAKSGSPDSGDYLLRIKSLKHRVVSSLSSHRRIHHRHQNKEFAAALDTSKQLRPPVQRLKSMPPPSSLKSHTNNRPPVARRGCSGGGSVSLANVLSGTTTRHNHRANLVRPIRGGGGDAVCNSMAPITASDRQQSSQYLTRQRLTQQADMAQVAYGAGLVVQPSQVDTMRNQEAASQSRLISLQQQQQLRQPRQSQYNEMDQIRALSRPYQWHWSETEKSHECIVNKDRLSLCFHPHCSESAAACRASEPLRRNGNYYYWEIYVHDKIYGTSVMFGLCTSRQRMHANDYCNLIGLDDCGWSLSHKGLAWHNGLGVQYTSVFPANQPITIGLLYNTMRGELSYFMNGKNLGVAFKGLNDIQQELYPVVASTAKCTQMTLLGSYCGYVSLLERSCFTLLKSVGVKDRLEFIEYLRKQNLPKHLLHYVAQAANVNCQSATVSGLDELATSGHPHEQTQQQHTAGNGTKYHPHVMPPRTGGGGGSSSSSRRIQKQE